MPKDLRSFLTRLEQRAPNELARVVKPVSPVFELPGIVRKFQSEGRYAVVLFDDVEGARLRAISNVLGSVRLLSEALETTPDELTRTYIDREDARLPVEVVTDAPVQEVVLTGSDIDLGVLPIVTNCEKDSGAFISAGVSTVRVPGTDTHNSGIYRMMVHSPTTLGMSYEKHAHVGRVHRHFEERGEPTEVVTRGQSAQTNCRHLRLQRRHLRGAARRSAFVNGRC